MRATQQLAAWSARGMWYPRCVFHCEVYELFFRFEVGESDQRVVWNSTVVFSRHQDTSVPVVLGSGFVPLTLSSGAGLRDIFLVCFFFEPQCLAMPPPDHVAVRCRPDRQQLQR